MKRILTFQSPQLGYKDYNILCQLLNLKDYFKDAILEETEWQGDKQYIYYKNIEITLSENLIDMLSQHFDSVRLNASHIKIYNKGE